MHPSLGASVEGLHLCNPLSPLVAEPHCLFKTRSWIGSLSVFQDLTPSAFLGWTTWFHFVVAARLRSKLLSASNATRVAYGSSSLLSLSPSTACRSLNTDNAYKGPAQTKAAATSAFRLVAKTNSPAAASLHSSHFQSALVVSTFGKRLRLKRVIKECIEVILRRFCSYLAATIIATPGRGQ